MDRRLLFSVLVLSPAAHGADGAEVAAGLGQMLLGLAVVVGLLLGTLWLLKRVAAPRGGASALRVLGAAPVGPRERVVLVEIAGKVLVLGVAPGRVTPLHTLETSELPTVPAAGSAPSVPFQDQLKKLLEGRK